MDIKATIDLLIESRLMHDFRTPDSMGHYLIQAIYTSSHPQFSRPRPDDEGYFILMPLENMDVFWDVKNKQFPNKFPGEDDPEEVESPYGGSKMKPWLRYHPIGAAIEVDHTKKVVNLDLEHIQHHRSRRSGGERASYTILGPSGHAQNHKINKLLMAVSRIDSAILDFEIIGSDSITGSVRSVFEVQLGQSFSRPAVGQESTSHPLPWD